MTTCKLDSTPKSLSKVESVLGMLVFIDIKKQDAKDNGELAKYAASHREWHKEWDMEMLLAKYIPTSLLLQEAVNKGIISWQLSKKDGEHVLLDLLLQLKKLKYVSTNSTGGWKLTPSGFKQGNRVVVKHLCDVIECKNGKILSLEDNIVRIKSSLKPTETTYVVVHASDLFEA